MKKIVYLLLLLLVPFMVSAKVLEADNNINYEGTHDSSSFLFGNSINNNGDINGIAVMAGNSINSKGKASYAVYAGNTLNISDEIENDLFAAGNVITITKDAKVPRDVYIAGSSIKILTDVGRDLYAGGETVDIRGITIHGNATIDADKVLMDEKTVIEGKLSYYKNTTIENLKVATIEEVKEINRLIEEHTKPTFLNRVKWEAIKALTGYVSILILFLVFPKLRASFDKNKDGAKEIALSTLAGLITIIVVPILSIIIMLPVVTIPISLLMLALYAFAIYFASLITAYLGGRYIYNKATDKDNLFLNALIGIVLLRLVSLIPVVGGIIVAICLFYGLGKIYQVFKATAFKK